MGKGKTLIVIENACIYRRLYIISQESSTSVIGIVLSKMVRGNRCGECCELIMRSLAVSGGHICRCREGDRLPSPFGLPLPLSSGGNSLSRFSARGLRLAIPLGLLTSPISPSILLRSAAFVGGGLGGGGGECGGGSEARASLAFSFSADSSTPPLVSTSLLLLPPPFSGLVTFSSSL